MQVAQYIHSAVAGGSVHTFCCSGWLSTVHPTPTAILASAYPTEASHHLATAKGWKAELA